MSRIKKRIASWNIAYSRERDAELYTVDSRLPKIISLLIANRKEYDILCLQEVHDSHTKTAYKIIHEIADILGMHAIFQKVNPSSDPFYRVTMHDPKIWSVLNNDVYYVPNGRNAQYCYMFMITNFIHVNPTRDEMAAIQNTYKIKPDFKLNNIHTSVFEGEKMPMWYKSLDLMDKDTVLVGDVNKFDNPIVGRDKTDYVLWNEMIDDKFIDHVKTQTFYPFPCDKQKDGSDWPISCLDSFVTDKSMKNVNIRVIAPVNMESDHALIIGEFE